MKYPLDAISILEKKTQALNVNLHNASDQVKLGIYLATLKDMESLLDTRELENIDRKVLDFLFKDLDSITKDVQLIELRDNKLPPVIDNLENARKNLFFALRYYEKGSLHPLERFLDRIIACRKDIRNTILIWPDAYSERYIFNYDGEDETELPRSHYDDNDYDITELDGVAKSDIFFTAYHPKEGIVKSWHTLLVYAHIISALAKVQKDAMRFDDQIKSPKETTSKSSTPIARGTELIIVPSCAGVTFNPERVSFKWMEDFHRADFRFRADKSLSGDAAKGSIDIYVGPLIIGTLKFAMLFSDKDVPSVPEHEEHAKMYGEDDVFISYSRKDTEVVRTFKEILEATGLDVFLDVDDLKSGQLWEKELNRRIERAKIFQIFWSANYSQSPNCKLEWKHALEQHKDEGYIRPVFWEKPISPKPPEELNKFNFKYVELKTSKDG